MNKKMLLEEAKRKIEKGFIPVFWISDEDIKETIKYNVDYEPIYYNMSPREHDRMLEYLGNIRVDGGDWGCNVEEYLDNL